MKFNIACVAACTRSHKPKIKGPLLLINKRRVKPSKRWIAATKTYNFMINDPICDWLCMQNATPKTLSSSRSSAPESDCFVDFIKKCGVNFESKLVEYINNNISKVVSVNAHISDAACRQTIELMKQGHPIIHSAPVRDHMRGTQGVIDLLVRSDYINQLVSENVLSEQETLDKAPYLKGNYHYRVIDIKFSTLPLRADGVHLLNSGKYPAYKAQLWIYNEAVARIQGYNSNKAYIMGRRWTSTCKDVKYKSFSCLNKLGLVDFSSVDKLYEDKTQKALKWIQDLTRSGKSWTAVPPSRAELYPNMCVDSGKLQMQKEIIADKIGEITSVWYCGFKHRRVAAENGVTSWRNKRCKIPIMGMNKSPRASIIEKILDVNRQNVDKIRPKTITNNLYNWKRNSGNELFVDFETLSDIFADLDHLPIQKQTDMIFMIGVGWIQNDKWRYTNFVCNNTSYQEEYRIMDEFYKFVAQRGFPKLNFWYADERFWNAAECRQFDIADEAQNEDMKDNISDNWKNLNNWVDMYQIFQTEPIVLKDCLKFGLKAVAKAMHKHGMIKTKIESECTSGLSAMVKAWNCYTNSSDPVSSPEMKDIAKYNEFDCCVLWEIISYLRKNHV